MTQWVEDVNNPQNGSLEDVIHYEAVKIDRATKKDKDGNRYTEIKLIDKDGNFDVYNEKEFQVKDGEVFLDPSYSNLMADLNTDDRKKLKAIVKKMQSYNVVPSANEVWREMESNSSFVNSASQITKKHLMTMYGGVAKKRTSDIEDSSGRDARTKMPASKKIVSGSFHFICGERHFSLQEFYEAEEQYKLSLKAKYKEKRCLLQLALIYANIKKEKLANNYFEKCIEYDTPCFDYRLYYYKSTSDRLLKGFDSAWRNIKRSRELLISTNELTEKYKKGIDAQRDVELIKTVATQYEECGLLYIDMIFKKLCRNNSNFSNYNVSDAIYIHGYLKKKLYSGDTIEQMHSLLDESKLSYKSIELSDFELLFEGLYPEYFRKYNFKNQLFDERMQIKLLNNGISLFENNALEEEAILSLIAGLRGYNGPYVITFLSTAYKLYENVALYLSIIGETKLSNRYWNELNKRCPNVPYINFSIGLNEYKMNNYKSAVNSFNKAKALYLTSKLEKYKSHSENYVKSMTGCSFIKGCDDFINKCNF